MKRNGHTQRNICSICLYACYNLEENLGHGMRVLVLNDQDDAAFFGGTQGLYFGVYISLSPYYSMYVHETKVF